MKAAMTRRYGPPEAVRLEEVPKPVPGDGEFLVRVMAAAVNSGDARVRAMRVPHGMKLPARLAMGWTGPKRPVQGFDAAGVVESTGEGVTHVAPGDRVLVSNGFALGCHAEYVIIGPQGVAAKIPDTLSFEEAVALPFGGATSLIFLESGGLKGGEHILINAAAGAVGVMAIQIAKHMGATVTAICSGKNEELVRSLGADHVIDYTKADFTRTDARYDVFMENHGNAPYGRVRHLLNREGRYLLVIGSLWQMIASVGQKAVILVNQKAESVTPENYARLLDWAAKGTIRPVIGASFPFCEIVEAHRLVDTGHKVGAVVVTMTEG